MQKNKQMNVVFIKRKTIDKQLPTPFEVSWLTIK